jgi:diguanylate cyclase (GGDEF)-like protein
VELKDPSLLLLRDEVGDCYESVTRSVAAAMGAESCHLALYDGVRREVVARRPAYTSRVKGPPQYRFPLEASAASSQVIETEQPHLSNDPQSDPLYDASIKESGVHSVLTAPVHRDGRVVALLYVLNKTGGFTPDDGRELMALSRTVALALENVRLFQSEKDRRILNESLLEVSRVLLGSPTEENALGTVLDQMWRVVRYQAAAAVLLDGDELHVAASRGGSADVRVPMDASGELGLVLERQALQSLSDAATLLPELGIRGATGKAMAAPLKAQQEVLGALVAVFEDEHANEAREGQLLSAFADHTALFLDAARLLGRERQARGRAANVARFTRLAATRLEPESLLGAAGEEILPLSGADRVVLYTAHSRNAVLIPVAHEGTAPAEEKRVMELRLDLSAPLLAPLVEERKTLVFQDATGPPPDFVTPFLGARALLLIPLVSRDVIVGAVSVAHLSDPAPFDRALIEYLHDVCQPLALGLENARLFSTLTLMAATDDMTGVANRRKFMETLRVEAVRSRRSTDPLSLLLVDLDHLKRINDTHGHQTGDLAIRHVADILTRRRRASDLPGRLGGEEFALLMPATGKEGALLTAERIVREVSGYPVPKIGTVTVSIGVATMPEDAREEEPLIRVADHRLYAAKAAGRNQVRSTSVPAELHEPGSAVPEAAPADPPKDGDVPDASS